MPEIRVPDGEMLYYCPRCKRLFTGLKVEVAVGEDRAQDGMPMRYCPECSVILRPRIEKVAELLSTRRTSED